MERQPIVTVCTKVYNTKPFLARCVESVLNQTFTDFEYILIDNGSTDGCKEMLEQYAAQDGRIRLIRFEKNSLAPINLEIPRNTGVGEYFTILDSDDWLEPTFLERMVFLAERDHLDIVCTDSAWHEEGHEDVISGTRSVTRQLVIGKKHYIDFFSYYHSFFRTVWGKLIRRKVIMDADLSIIEREKVVNGADTLAAFAWLRQAERICIDNSVLHHYLVRKKSVSRVYHPGRFKSNVILHQNLVNFLSQYGPISEENYNYVHRIYANNVVGTLEVLWYSGLSPDEKLAHYSAIAAHPITREAYQDTHPEISNSRDMLFRLFMTALKEARNMPENLSEAAQALLPRCGQAVTGNNIILFTRELALMETLLQDDPDKLAECLLKLIQGERYTKQYDLGAMLQALAQDKPLLRGISDFGFLRQYCRIYWLVWKEQNLEELDAMTGLLLENRVQSFEEEFLQLYLSVAALLEEIPAFLFGKIKTAQFYLRRRRKEDCRAILSELEAMGMEDNEELADIRRQLAVLDEE